MNVVERITRTILNSFFGVLLFVVSMAAFYLPYEIRIIPQVKEYLTPVRLVCAGILILAFFFLYASSLTVFRNNWALWAAVLFALVLVFSTQMNGGDMESALGTHGMAGIFLLMCIAVFFKTNPKMYLLIAFFLLLAVNIGNTYTVYRYWGVGMWEEYGLYRNWFYSLVGNYNGGIEYVIPMAICGSAYACRYGKWLELLNYPAMIMSLVMAVKCDSETQIIAFALILVFMIIGDIGLVFPKFAGFLKIICQPVILVAVDFAAFISIVVINRTNWVAALGLDPDFHNRRHVWNMTMDWIRTNPIWGNGQETVAAEASKITGYAHSHSTYLEAAYKTGFIGCVCLLLMLAAVIVAIYRNRNRHISYILSVLLFVTGLAGIAESYPMVYVMLCFGLIYYIAKNTGETPDLKERVQKMNPVTESQEPKVQDESVLQKQPEDMKELKEPAGPDKPASVEKIQEENLVHIGETVREMQNTGNSGQ